MNNSRVPETALPVIPETVTVHLGAPNSPAPNVTVPFADYIKNVASSEIYPTWPEAAIRANIYAQQSFALNRIYTEYYRSRGYDFDITNSTAIDQSFVNGRDIFENISRIVDDIFGNYIRRRGSVEPLFAAYCDGVEVQCGGLSQWGTVPLAEQGLTPYEILQTFYGDDIDIITDVPVEGAGESYPGVPLVIGSINNAVRTVQLRLNRISKNFPAIPKIPAANGVFDGATRDAVLAFQRSFDLAPDGIVGRGTWYSIARIWAGVKRLADLNAEGVPVGDVTDLFNEVLAFGDVGTPVRDLQYFLAFVSVFNNAVEPPAIDGIFGRGTESALRDFQQAYGLPVTGEADLVTWRRLYDAYRGYVLSLPAGYFGVTTALYPGTPLLVGSRGEDVRLLQGYLNGIGAVYGEIPAVVEDGVFGERTAEAVRAFQRLFGIEPSDLAASTTWNAVTQVYRDGQEGRYGSAGQFGGVGAAQASQASQASL